MPRSSPQAMLLVDGYNVVGLWAELRRVRDREGLELARRQLVEVLANYSAFQGFDTQVVFDSQYRNTSGNREVITPNLAVHYTDFGQTADTFIEKTCANFRYDIRKFHQRLIVATSDQAQRLTVVGYGAEWMSAERLAAEVEGVIQRVQHKQKSAKKPSGRFLADALDPVAQQRLTQLRFGKK
ncbi:NYN domain-containing protein [Kovacikia minuta CCNUW1]|uniref:NYN domain-containing protein n=1 Tax=Kovacikia minuta TaxID=2931930 RepID=UPI001CCCAD70|nr:NYN domain-containing protein [Kovacikia minuta]UBF26445.1 NYN domain-containing protein [Kovacikia minuta CCNUW1]